LPDEAIKGLNCHRCKTILNGFKSCEGLDVEPTSRIFLFVSKVEQMETELRKLSQDELRRIRECVDDLIEDQLEFTPEFERSIEQSERDMREGKTARVREPSGVLTTG
jgi:hypothetical protein